MKKQVSKKVHQFPTIDQVPSLLGFGCMRLPTTETGAIDEARAEAMIDYAYQRGVTYFDTAWPYHGGESETFMGRVLKKYPRQSFQLANKMPSWEIESLDDVKRIFEAQLEKCQVDYFDYYLCHAMNKTHFEVYKKPGIMDYLVSLKREGKIKYLGFSFHDTPEVLAKIMAYHPWDFVMLQLNYLDWDFQDAKSQYDIVTSHKIPCLVMEPVRGGTLATLSEDARAVLKEADASRSIASWAVRYAASKPNVMVVLSGMSDMAQTQDNIETLTNFEPLNDTEQGVIDKALEIFLKARIVPCTSCGYCVPCPHGVAIPNMFETYNNYAVSHHERPFIRSYESYEVSKRAEACIDCGECVPKCPQNIDIPERLAHINSRFKHIKSQHEETSS